MASGRIGMALLFIVGLAGYACGFLLLALSLQADITGTHERTGGMALIGAGAAAYAATTLFFIRQRR